MPTGAAWGVICLCLAALGRMNGAYALPVGKGGRGLAWTGAALPAGGCACCAWTGQSGFCQVENRGAFFRSRARAIITGGRGLPGDVEVCFMPAGIDETIFDHETPLLRIRCVMLNNNSVFLTFA